ncbi:unnamed protein product [Rotaria socialis]|uniref:Uncharacterized protein n=2 Tax=Rotaria socialis TaxID=392032 RepID=A0A821G291_9BILA|nr:unnamed protein product [Rotaria socialis]
MIIQSETTRFTEMDGSAVGSERSWWFNPLPSSHHFSNIYMFSVTLSDNFSFIPVSTTCYDDPTKDYRGRAASNIVLDNQTHVMTSLKLCDELRSNLILKTGGTESVQMILHQKLVCGICQETLIIDLPISSKTNTPLVEDQCVVINIGTELPDTTRVCVLFLNAH